MEGLMAPVDVDGLQVTGSGFREKIQIVVN